MKTFDIFLESAVSKLISLCLGQDFKGTDSSFRERYHLSKNRLGIQLFESELGFEQMVHIIYGKNINVQKNEFYQNGVLTFLGEEFITMFLNKIYLVGLENIKCISISNLEILEHFFDDLELNPYKNNGNIEETVKEIVK